MLATESFSPMLSLEYRFYLPVICSKELGRFAPQYEEREQSKENKET